MIGRVDKGLSTNLLLLQNLQFTIYKKLQKKEREEANPDGKSR